MNIRYVQNFYNSPGYIIRDILSINDEPHMYTVSEQDNFTELCPVYPSKFHAARHKQFNCRASHALIPLDLENPSSSVDKLFKIALLT